MISTICVLAALSAVAHAAAPAVGGSLSQDGITYIKDQAIPALSKKLNNLQIPPVSGKKDSFDYSLTNVVCNGQVTGGALTLVANTGLSASITGFSMNCNGDWKFREEIWPHPSASGSLTASMSDSSMSLDLGATVNSKGDVVLSASNIAINLNDFDLHFSGGIVGWLVNIIADLFKGTIRDQVEDFAKSELTEFINTDANALLAQFSWTLELPFPAPYNISEAQFNITNDFTFDTNYVGVDMLGAIVNKDDPTAYPPLPPPVVPKFSSSAADHYLQFFASPWMIESLAYTYLNAHLTQFVITHEDIPASSPITLNTTWLALVAPGITAKYPNDWAQITIAETGLLRANAGPGGVTASTPITLDFQAITASGPAEAFTLGCNLSLAIDILARVNETTGGEVIWGNMSYIDCPLQTQNSSVGPVNTGLLNNLVSFIFSDVVLPFANLVLEAGIPLPTLDGVTFKDLEVVYGDGYALVASNFEYTPPSETIENTKV